MNRAEFQDLCPKFIAQYLALLADAADESEVFVALLDCGVALEGAGVPTISSATAPSGVVLRRYVP